MTEIQPPPLRNDCFALPPGVDWTPVNEAKKLLKDALSTVVSAGHQDSQLKPLQIESYLSMWSSQVKSTGI